MWGSKLWLFPVAVFVFIPLTFIISYIIAVCAGHVAPGFPYISDTGTEPPESCIFGQMLNIGAVLAGITLYIRYRDVEENLKIRDITQRSCVHLSCLNNIGFVLGICSALGASIVANFQETKVLVVHLIGAFMTFGLGSIYCWCQTYITYKLCGASLKIANLRLGICVTNTVFFIILVVSTPVAMGKFSGFDPKYWQQDEGGFAEHIVSTVSEWAMALAMMVYFLTFVKEFRNFGMRCPVYYRHCDEQITGKIRHLSLDNSTSNQGETTCPESPESTSRNIHNESNGSLDRIITV
ncbi:DNA damage-regulated autophagy modulator protein 1-like isoform X1 [Liolophura sinensis]|uniref:DNA damage-regulated autophagy modulator protein 1-like isoform X1 n=1 Tax=Liolophura sinensis TaxID=3198878 RepID=UPI00315849B8